MSFFFLSGEYRFAKYCNVHSIHPYFWILTVVAMLVICWCASLLFVVKPSFIILRRLSVAAFFSCVSYSFSCTFLSAACRLLRYNAAILLSFLLSCFFFAFYFYIEFCAVPRCLQCLVDMFASHFTI